MKLYRPTARAHAALQVLMRAGLIRCMAGEVSPAISYLPVLSFQACRDWYNGLTVQSEVNFQIVEPIETDDPRRRFSIVFENVGFTNGDAAEIDDAMIAEANALILSKGIAEVRIIEASVGADDSVHEDGRDEDGDQKSFVSVTIEAWIDPSKIDDIRSPADIHTKLENAFKPLCGDLDMEGNWEYLEHEELRGTVVIELGDAA
jgi:hypothetical protein